MDSVNGTMELIVNTKYLLNSDWIFQMHFGRFIEFGHSMDILLNI